MSWPLDEAKLGRVQDAMRDHELDALIARAPDNVVYLTNYRVMKGYDIAVFPQRGEATLIVIEAQLEEAHRTSWTSDIRPFKGYDERDPRPPTARALEVALDVVGERGLGGRVGLELSQGTQAADLMVGEPTTPTASFFSALPNAEDASGLLAEVRMIKTAQEIERMRLANELATRAMEHVRDKLRPGMRETEAAAMWEGHVHAHGVGFEDKVEMARGYSLVWSGTGIRTFTATGNRPIAEDQPTLFEIWVSADGYWCDHTKNVCPGALRADYETLLETLLAILAEARALAVPGASLAAIDRHIRERIAEAGYPGQPSHPVCHGVGARAHEPPYAHQAGGGTIREGMVLAIEPGLYWEGGGGLRLEDNYLITASGNEQLGRFPDDFR